MHSKEDVAKKASLVNVCMLENSMFTVVGVAAGSAVSIKMRKVRPFIVGVTLGTLGDMTYGYLYSCRSFIDDYNKSKAAYEASKAGTEQS